MDTNSSLGKICLGDDVIEILSDKVEGSTDWNSPEYQDTAGSKGKKVTKALSFYKMETDEFGEELPPLVCKMGKSSRNKKSAMENLSFFYQDIGTSSSADKVELDGMIMKEEKEAIKKVKGKALKEKDDHRAFIFPIRLEGRVNKNALADTGSDINTMPYRIYEQLGREEMKKVDRGITMINHTEAEAMGILTNVLCQVGVTTLIAKFLILDIPIDRDAQIVVGQGFLHIIRWIVNTPERIFLTFDGFCHQTFCATRSDVLRTA
ncbi:DNA-directed DNA polymerase [Tanacetum coccineum]